MKKVLSLTLILAIFLSLHFSISKAEEIDSAFGAGTIRIEAPNGEPQSFDFGDLSEQAQKNVEISKDQIEWTKEFTFESKNFTLDSNATQKSTLYLRNNASFSENNSSLPIYDIKARNISNFEMANKIYIVLTTTYGSQQTQIYSGSLANLNGLDSNNYISIPYAHDSNGNINAPIAVEFQFSINDENIADNQELTYEILFSEVI